MALTSEKTDLNLVPFIDIMTVLVAFLLITAAWSHTRQLDAHAGETGSATTPPGERPISILVSRDALWFGVADVTTRKLPAGDTAGLDQVFADLRLPASRPVEIAAEDDVSYQEIVSAMDIAVRRHPGQVSYASPHDLATRFHE